MAEPRLVLAQSSGGATALVIVLPCSRMWVLILHLVLHSDLHPDLATLVAPTAEDCADAYYGIDHAKNLPKALTCYAAESDWVMVALMHLNGEGTPRDLKAARAALNHLVTAESSESFLDADAQTMLQAIAQQEEHPKSHARIDHCNNIASTTLSLNECASIQQRLTEKTQRRRLANVEKKLDAAERRWLAQVEQSARLLADADGARMYQIYIDGSIRNLAAMAQTQLVRDNFLGAVERFIGRREIPLADPAEVDVEKSDEGDVTDADTTGDLHKASDDAQVAWVRYRNAWEALVTHLRFKGLSSDKAWVRIRSELTKRRAAELKNDPVGPG